MSSTKFDYAEISHPKVFPFHSIPTRHMPHNMVRLYSYSYHHMYGQADTGSLDTVTRSLRLFDCRSHHHGSPKAGGEALPRFAKSVDVYIVLQIGLRSVLQISGLNISNVQFPYGA